MVVFYKETEFKDTEIGRIPKEWEIRRLYELFQIETGTTPSTKNKEYWNGNIRWITPKDLSRIKDQLFVSDSERKITQKAVEDCNLSLMPKDSIIISTRAPVGYVAVINESMTFNQGCKGLIPKGDGLICASFYAYYFLSIKNRLLQLSGGITFKDLSKQTLENLKIPLPPLDEQQQTASILASILSTIDQAIQKTDEVIAKTERLKKGMMNELLTKGIEHKKFKDTEIGRIPKGWEIHPFSTFCEYTKGRVPKVFKDTQDSALPYISLDAIRTGKVTRYGVQEQQSVMVDVGDIILVWDGDAGEFLHNKNPGILAGTLAKITVSSEVDPTFLFYQLSTNRKVKQAAIGAVISHVDPKVLRNLPLLIPPLDEQQQIALFLSKFLTSLDDQIEVEEKIIKQLKDAKRFFMNTLLTGKIRIKEGPE